MFSRILGSQQTEKGSQEQVSDKAAAGVTALAKLVYAVGADTGIQVSSKVCKVRLSNSADRM